MADQLNLERYQLKQVDVRLRLKESDVLYSASPIDSPDAAVRIMADALRDMDREMVCVVNLDVKNRPINFNVVSIGSINESVIPIQNVFKSAILSNSASIMLLHTHPSGVALPSPEDDRVTKRLANACSLMDIKLLDHIIIGSVTGNTYSYNENNPDLLRADTAFIIDSIAREEQPEYGGMNTMKATSFEEFSKQIGDALKEELASRGIEGEIRYEDVRKIGQSYHGMTVVQGDMSASPVFNLDSLYQDYLGGEPFPLKEMAGYVENAIGLVNIREGLMDYDKIKDNLFIRLSNRNANRDLLKEVPYTTVEDLMVTYHIRIDSARGEMAAMVSNHMLENYGITVEQLHEDAVNSSMKVHPGRLMTMQEAMFGQMAKEMRNEGLSDNEIREMQNAAPFMPTPPLYVITNLESNDGAAALLYPGMMDQAAEMLGDNFYILPSSRHEVILVPPDMVQSYRDLEDMVHQVNESQVAPEDRLSDHVYHYEHGGRGLELARDYEKRQHHKEQKKTVGMEL